MNIVFETATAAASCSKCGAQGICHVLRNTDTNEMIVVCSICVVAAMETAKKASPQDEP